MLFLFPLRYRAK